MEKNLKGMAAKQSSSPSYRDTLFRTLFSDEERAIELCNAVAGTSFPPGTPVTMCGLKSSLLRRYNDLAVAVKGQIIVMIEHQSTVNPNMPLRFLKYLADELYSSFVKGDEIYRSTVLKIPTPQFYVLYNGTKKLGQDTLMLSSAFEVAPTGPSMELTARVLDINHESGCEALSKSKSLNGYAYMVAQIRHFESKGLPRDAAIKEAVMKCKEEDVLADFLKSNHEEVAKMLMWEYDQEAEFRILREEGRQEGEEKTKTEMAIEMLKDGLNTDKIARYVKMPVDWVKKITESNFESPEKN